MNPKHSIRINEIHDRNTASVQSDDIVTYRSDPIHTFSPILSSQRKNGCACGAEENHFRRGTEMNRPIERNENSLLPLASVSSVNSREKRCREIIMRKGFTNENHGNFNGLTLIASNSYSV